MALVVVVADAVGEDEVGFGNVLVGDLGQEVGDAVEAGLLLVDRLNHPPRGFLDVGFRQHLFLGLGVIFPVDAAFHVHR